MVFTTMMATTSTAKSTLYITSSGDKITSTSPSLSASTSVGSISHSIAKGIYHMINHPRYCLQPLNHKHWIPLVRIVNTKAISGLTAHYISLGGATCVLNNHHKKLPKRDHRCISRAISWPTATVVTIKKTQLRQSKMIQSRIDRVEILIWCQWAYKIAYDLWAKKRHTGREIWVNLAFSETRS